MAEQLTDYAQFNGHQELSLVLSKVGGESTKHGPLVHGPGPSKYGRVHGPLSWTGSMDPLFLLHVPLKLLK